ncbi:MAG: site-specific integrase [Desulfobulbaceae bacterium]|jgi:integrase|nr:site-specific integrase [Desulfobulbaceae bacterium]
MRNGYSITRDKFLSVHEVSRLLAICAYNAAQDAKCGRKTWVTRYMLVHLALNSGLRVSEIAALKMSDLHLVNGEDNYLIVRHGKGRGAHGKKRDVYLDQEIASHLRQYIAHKRAWQESASQDSPLFAGRSGRHYTTTALEISFKKAVAAANLPLHYSIHSSRHTYATLLLAKTSNLRFVQKQLGHASLNMTALYANVLPELNQSLANMLIE